MPRLRLILHAIVLIVLTGFIVLYFGSSDTKYSKSSALPVVSVDMVAKLEIGEDDLVMQEQEAVPLDYRENDLLYRPPLDIAVIFTHSENNLPLQYKLRIAVGSLLLKSSAPLRLHLITDEDGFHIASNIINDVQSTNRLDTRHLKLVYVSADDFIHEIEDSVKILQLFFTTRRDAYYRDALFFFSVHLHKLLPGLDKVILMDIDIKFKGDIAELHSHFNHFSPTQIIGMSFEQSPVYRHLLSLYRKQNPKSHLGSPPSEGGFPGYNSGVVLIDIQKLRKSVII
ncbi:Xyloside xylosyltransferase 1, partial [Halocaridina rubra]